MERKLNEFLTLTQGTRTVIQYVQAFNNLCHYAGYHVDTDAKKRDHFRRGLSTKLKDHLNPIKVDIYIELVNLAITQEDCIMAHRAEKKRKAPAEPSNAPPQRYRLVQHAMYQAPQKPLQPGQWVFRSPQQQGVSRPHVPQQTSPRPIAQQLICPSNAKCCFIYGNSTHFARDCPRPDSQIKAKALTRMIRTKGRLISPLLQSFLRVHR
jgi:hypothetical protein